MAPLQLILTLALLNPIFGIQIKTCNCSRPMVRGTLDLSDPPYCKEIQKTTSLLVTYKIITKPKPPIVWTGYSCQQWLKEKQIETFFFGSHDTVFHTATRLVSEGDCWKMARYPNECGQNTLVKEGSTLSFMQDPDGGGYWLTVQKYTILNCLVSEISLRKDCPDCPIHSPFGVLKNVTNNRVAHLNDITFVWDPPQENKTDCSSKEIFSGTGLFTRTNDDSHALITDKISQLEYHIPKDPVTLCIHKEMVYPIMGLPDVYLIWHTSKSELPPHVSPPRLTMNYLKNKKRIPSVDTILYSGTFRTASNVKYCLMHQNTVMRLRWCDALSDIKMPDAKFGRQFEYLTTGIIKTEENRFCISYFPTQKQIILSGCDPVREEEKDTFPSRWVYHKANKTLVEVSSDMCLFGIFGSGSVALHPCEDGIVNGTREWFWGFRTRF